MKGQPFGAAAAWLTHRVLVTVGVRSAGPRTVLIRAVTIAAVLGTLFALQGAVRFARPPASFARSPLGLDLALRSIALGWYDTEGTWPVAIVDIDEETHRSWGSPAVAPRPALAQVVINTLAARPSAVIIDVDLSWGHAAYPTEAQIDDQPLRDLLAAASSSVPILLPKRLSQEPDGRWTAAAGTLDSVIAGSSAASWAHAFFESDSRGRLRRYHDWLDVCSGNTGMWLPSMPVRLSAAVETLPANVSRPVVPLLPSRGCDTTERKEVGQRRLLFGPRLAGSASVSFPDHVPVVPARLVERSPHQLDLEGLFHNRVVLIGATHSAAGDRWLTPVGLLPGVELLANQVRFWPFQQLPPSVWQRLGDRGLTLLLFGLFVLLDRKFRAVVALLLSVLCSMIIVVLTIRISSHYRVLDAVESAIFLMLAYKLLMVSFNFVAEVNVRRRDFPSGWQGTLMTIRTLFMKDDPREVTDHADD